jgi:DNA-binding NarL/FixJ family response regulator
VDYSKVCIAAFHIDRNNVKAWGLAGPARHSGPDYFRNDMATRILIADDNPLVRECIGKLLGSHLGWEVCGEATDGKDAVRQARQLAPDVVVLDFLMPGLNGIEAARQIAAVSPKIPILLCTIYLTPQLLDLARNAGITGALSKGDLNQLVKCVETILRGDTFFHCNKTR